MDRLYPGMCCKSLASVAVTGGLGRFAQAATAGSLTVRSPLTGAMDSSVMYLLETAHSSFCSSRIAPTRRVMASSLGKMPTTLVRRLTSICSRSMGLVTGMKLSVPLSPSRFLGL